MNSVSPEPQPWKMSRGLRNTTYAICTLLWISGCWWIALHYCFQALTQFGPGPSPWEPVAIRLHGVLAVAGVFLLGFITSRHVASTWDQNRNRPSGIALCSAYAVLVASGYALYYVVDDRSRSGIALTHELIGAGAIVLALAHWLRGRRPSRQPPGA